jgi:hypothetical protein
MGCLSWSLGHGLPPASYITAHCDSVEGIEVVSVGGRQRRQGWPVIALGECVKLGWVGRTAMVMAMANVDGSGEWARR